MTHITHSKTMPAKPILLFSSFIILGLTILSLSFLEIQKLEYSNFAVPVSTPIVIAVKVPVKKIQKKVAVVVPKKVLEIPEMPQAHLKIPKIGVNTVIKEMGVTSDGAMAVPGNRVDVGWFSLGTRPGQVGSAVIGGHNRFDGDGAVFADLNQLERGDVLSVVDAKGVSTSFVVRDMRTYDATDTNTGIFESESGAHLNLITCSGVWDPVTKTSTQRLVIFTDVYKNTQSIAMMPTQTP